VVDWADLQFTYAPIPLLGDFNRDNHVNTADVSAMLAALVDLNGYTAANSLSNFDLLAIGDLNHDGVVNNADLQSMLTYLVNGGGSAATVPEPGGWLMSILGCGVVLVVYRRRKRSRGTSLLSRPCSVSQKFKPTKICALRGHSLLTLIRGMKTPP
jgi:hypothetical protein